MPIKKGDKAPDFNLFDTDKNKVSLSDYAGKQNVLLLFFPFAFTSVCTAELCQVRDDISNYNAKDVQVLGISVDSVFSLAKYKEEQGLQYPLLSDFNKAASTIFDSIYDSFTNMDFKGVSKRSAFLIDKKGIVQYAEVLDNAGQVPDFQAIMTEISRFN